MTLLSQIITDAYRETNLIRLGTEPNTAQLAEGLRLLQTIISSIYGSDAGENLNDFPLGNYGVQPNDVFVDGQWTQNPPINSRLISNATQAKTVYLPTYPSAGSRMQIVDPYARLAAYPVTLDGNGRTIEGAATLLLDTNSENVVWFYTDETANWVRLTSLAVTDPMPFPNEYDDLFAIMLAMRINPRYGKNMAPESLARLKQQRQEFTNRYLQSAPLQINPDLAYPTQQSYDNYFWGFPGGSTTADFNRGGGW